MANLIDNTKGAENMPGGRTEGGTLPASPHSATHEALLTSLSARQRIAYLMSERVGLSDRDIAAHLHIKAGDARRLIDEARAELRRLQLARAQGVQKR